MIELIKSILEDSRSPERTEDMMRLVNILVDTYYGDTLHKVYEITSTNDNIIMAMEAIENLICNCTYTLVCRMGITISVENIYRSPGLVADIIDTILVEVDNFDDYDTMLQIVQNEENEVEAIGCLVGFVIHAQEHKYIEIISNVTEDCIKTLQQILTSRAMKDIDESSAVDLGIAKQLRFFAKSYPESPVLPLLTDGGYVEPMMNVVDKLVARIDGDTVRDYATSLAGILFTHTLSYDDAYEKVEYLSEYVVHDDSGFTPGTLAMNISDILDKLFRGLGSFDE